MTNSSARARLAAAQRVIDTAAPRWVKRVVGSGPATTVRSPFDQRVLAEVPTSTPADVAEAARIALAAQESWATRSIDERAQVLLDFHDQLLDRRDEFADLVQLEAGKSRLNAIEEVLHVALTARYYGRTARRYLRNIRASGLFPLLTRIDRHYLPKGLVGVIAPWNYPFTMAISDALPAIAAGNAVLLKPDVQTPLVALAAVELLEAAGMPPGLWQVVNGPGSEVGPLLIDQVDYVCFTGSTTTGKTVAARCAERLIGCSLELGGKNPLLILDDADLDQAAAGAVRACFANAGQLCVSAERIYVDHSVAEKFLESFVAKTSELRLGASLNYAENCGSLINSGQLERVQAHVADAVDKGARVRVGGRARADLGPLFFEPTILTDVSPDADLYAGETFGPVVSVYPVADEDEAIARANDSEYGLNGSVWTTDLERGRRVAAQIRCGTVNVNEGFAATFGSIDAPMGGMKSSGLGRRQGEEGIRRFVEVQAIGTQSGIPIAPSLGLGPKAFVSAMTGALRVLKKAGRA